MATAKTNAVRLLDRPGIRYELRTYDVDPDDLAAETVAQKIGMYPEQVFKTLIARGDKHGVCLAMVPGNCELDLKALAKTTGNKKTETVPLKEIEPLTGYIRGGVTALACKKPYPVYLDETAQLFDVISISAGLQGLKSSSSQRITSVPCLAESFLSPRARSDPEFTTDEAQAKWSPPVH
jgi:Cys-tRNA(Pro)/Cys-tRNA(Cys) deacylase